MKKLAMLLLLCSPAWAGWKSVGTESTADSYADASSRVRSGNIVTMWSLLDYKGFQRMVEIGYFSHKALVEYDCVRRQTRGLVVALHAGHMGAGKIVYADESSPEWEPLVPQTMGEALWKVACQEP